MTTPVWAARRGQLEHYFDRTAHDAWARLTSDAPVGRIRATVRAGRDAMRATLLDWLPADLSGRRILDAGCGTGALAVAAAERGAEVIGVDISPKLVALGRERIAGRRGAGSVELVVGDFTDPALGPFDHVVAMDSLIHYPFRRWRGCCPVSLPVRGLHPLHLRAVDAAARRHAHGRQALPPRQPLAGHRARIGPPARRPPRP